MYPVAGAIVASGGDASVFPPIGDDEPVTMEPVALITDFALSTVELPSSDVAAPAVTVVVIAVKTGVAIAPRIDPSQPGFSCENAASALRAACVNVGDDVPYCAATSKTCAAMFSASVEGGNGIEVPMAQFPRFLSFSVPSARRLATAAATFATADASEKGIIMSPLYDEENHGTSGHQKCDGFHLVAAEKRAGLLLLCEDGS